MTERRVRRGLLNEGGDSVAKNEEEDQELHVPTVNQSCDKERNLHFLKKKYTRWKAVFPGSEWSIPMFLLKSGRSLTEFTTTFTHKGIHGDVCPCMLYYKTRWLE